MFRILYVLACLQFLYVVQALSLGYAPLRTHHNADVDTTIAIKRALHAARGTTHTTNRTYLTKSWADATLFSIGASSSTNSSEDATLDLEVGLSVTCTACYINGSVSSFLTVENNFNVTEAVDSVIDEIANVTESAFDQLETYARDSVDDLPDIPAWPTLDLDFDLDDTVAFPDVHAQFEFNDLELYLELDVQLSAGATYTLNLFTSESVAGFSIPGLEAGALFKVSLVLIAQAEINISSGIHIKLDDGLALDLELFNKNVSGITLPGGRMEFLPITIEGHGSLQALLQLEASVGFEIAPPDSLGVLEVVGFSAGIGTEVFAYVADFLFQVDASTDEDAECAVEAVAEYTLAVGAAAGATIAVADYQWGPAPSTTVPVFYTTLASICAGTKTSSSTITPSATLEQRDSDLKTTTVSTTTTYTAVNCASQGLVNCPVRLQRTTSIERAMTTVLTVESGIEATFPASTFTSLTGAIPFGDNVRRLGPTSGTPVSYVPPPVTPSPTGDAETGDDDTSESADDMDSSNNNKLIIGLSVGLVVPAVIVAGFALWWFVYKRKRYAAVPQPETTVYSPGESKGVKRPLTTVGAA
ncbi:hypothetical protein BDW59DRAFT_148614 [Aspergillus cavernicola]|uniref:Mid2 domain-containing protein n=1 Tax=Aspergillus cavernicola TaxID=176166 RepID=A0ABR4I6P7_9EURO